MNQSSNPEATWIGRLPDGRTLRIQLEPDGDHRFRVDLGDDSTQLRLTVEQVDLLAAICAAPTIGATPAIRERLGELANAVLASEQPDADELVAATVTVLLAEAAAVRSGVTPTIEQLQAAVCADDADDGVRLLFSAVQLHYLLATRFAEELPTVEGPAFMPFEHPADFELVVDVPPDIVGQPATVHGLWKVPGSRDARSRTLAESDLDPDARAALLDQPVEAGRLYVVVACRERWMMVPPSALEIVAPEVGPAFCDLLVLTAWAYAGGRPVFDRGRSDAWSAGVAAFEVDWETPGDHKPVVAHCDGRVYDGVHQLTLTVGELRRLDVLVRRAQRIPGSARWVPLTFTLLRDITAEGPGDRRDFVVRAALDGFESVLDNDREDMEPNPRPDAG